MKALSGLTQRVNGMIKLFHAGRGEVKVTGSNKTGCKDAYAALLSLGEMFT